jgi:hypothetical protein
MAGYLSLIGVLLVLAGAVFPPLAVFGFLLIVIGAVSGMLNLLDRVFRRGAYKRTRAP